MCVCVFLGQLLSGPCHRTTCSYLQPYQSINRVLIDCYLPNWWMLRWAHYWLVISSVSSRSPVSAFLFFNSWKIFFQHSIFYYPMPNPPSDCSTSNTLSLTPCLNMDIHTPHHTWPPNSLESPVSRGLGESSLNEHRPGSSLLDVGWESHISWCMLSV